jgi:hypothetical protein
MNEKNAPRPIVEQSSSTSSSPECDKIVGESIAERSGACEDARRSDERQSAATAEPNLQERSLGVEKALRKVEKHGLSSSDPVGYANPPEITETGATESDAYLAAKQSPFTRSSDFHDRKRALYFGGILMAPSSRNWWPLM